VASLPAGAIRLTWSRDGRQIAAISGVRITLWDVASNKLVQSIDAGDIDPPLWTPGRPVICGLGTTKLAIWDSSSGRFLHQLEGHTAAVTAAAWSRDGKFVASGGLDRGVRVWDASSGKLLQTLEGHTAQVMDVAWSTDGRSLASASRDKTVRLWDLSGKSKGVLEKHTDMVTVLAWAPTGNVLASGGNDQNIFLWNPDTRQVIRTIEAYQPVQALAWAPTGKILACGTRDDRARIYNTANGELMANLERSGSPPNVSAVTWLSGGAFLFAGRGNHRAQLWNARTGKLVHDLQAMAPVQYVNSAANGYLLVGGNQDRTVRFWDTASGQLRGALVGEKNCIVLVGADGNWKADPEKETDLVYVVQTPQLQETLTAAEFGTRFRWKNSPTRVVLPTR
jgi:WD40 repeat protein